MSGPGDLGREARLTAAEDALTAVMAQDEEILTEQEFRTIEAAEVVLVFVRRRREVAR